MRVIRTLVAATMLLILCVGFAGGGIWSAPVSGDTGPQKVQVMNTPLPVSVQGTAPVSASQSGAWNVGLASGASVNVGNAASNPVPVRDVGTPEPVAVQTSLFWTETASQCFEANLYEVPAGKRLVIEHISGFGFLPLGQTFDFASLAVPGQNGDYYRDHLVPPHKTATHNGIQDNFSLYLQTKLYAEPGLPLVFMLCRDFVGQASQFTVTMTGYLTPVP